MSDLNEIDNTVIKRIIMRIIVEEKENVKTKQKTDSQMVDMLRKIIQEEVDAY